MRDEVWTEIPIGGIIEDAGNAATYETGSWRTYRPIWNSETCIHCLAAGSRAPTRRSSSRTAR